MSDEAWSFVWANDANNRARDDVAIDRCYCNHPAYLHTPTGHMDDTTERGHGTCTAGPWGQPCWCTEYRKKET